MTHRLRSTLLLLAVLAATASACSTRTELSVPQPAERPAYQYPDAALMCASFESLVRATTGDTLARTAARRRLDIELRLLPMYASHVKDPAVDDAVVKVVDEFRRSGKVDPEGARVLEPFCRRAQRFAARRLLSRS